MQVLVHPVCFCLQTEWDLKSAQTGPLSSIQVKIEYFLHKEGKSKFGFATIVHLQLVVITSIHSLSLNNVGSLEASWSKSKL